MRQKLFSFVLMGVFMMAGLKKVGAAPLISHGESISFDKKAYEDRLRTHKNDLVFPLDQEIDLLDQLTKFELGRFLLQNRGLNGYWTSYVILHGPQKEGLSPLETWLVRHSPVVKSTQERFKIFQQKLQNFVREGITLMSLPCGVMDDLLRLDYSDVSSFRLIGVDLDRDSLKRAEQSALEQGVSNVDFIHRDAWELGLHEVCDVLASNGLNIYEPDDRKVVDLYRQFYKALKPGGILITSFLTPPPTFSEDSPWKNYNPEDVKKQKAILGDIMQIKWQTFRTEALTRSQLEKAGFIVREIIYDSQSMFPTVVAEKSSSLEGLRIVKDDLPLEHTAMKYDS